MQFMLNSGGRLIVLTLSSSIILLPFFLMVFGPTSLDYVAMNVSNRFMEVVVLCLLSLGDASLALFRPFNLNFELTTILGRASGSSCLISKG
jgi:hypothetical protein